MSYTAAIDQLNAMVPELYTGSGQTRRKFSLSEVRTLLGALGDPGRRLRCVLIAGTRAIEYQKLNGEAERQQYVPIHRSLPTMPTSLETPRVPSMLTVYRGDTNAELDCA